MNPKQEEELLEKIKTDPKQFGVLFDHYYKPIFGYIFRRIADYDRSRDIAADTFLKAFLKISNFSWKGIPLSVWLYKIATNEINYYFRKQKYSPISFQNGLNIELLNLGNSESMEAEKIRLEEELKQHGDFALIQRELKTLDIKYQEVISLRYFENKDNKEISEILEKPEGTIKSLLSRGLEKLRTKMME